MALTLRDEFGDLIKWKVILIVELVLLVVFGSMAFPEVILGAITEKPETPAQNNAVLPGSVTNAANETEFKGKVISGAEYCDERIFCIVMKGDGTDRAYVVRYNSLLGGLYEGELVHGIGVFEGDVIEARAIESDGLDILLEWEDAE
ncbi:MAG: hypothetical protein JXB14_00990 [Candidatus Altiarchaeota archaeon]|nr:hypothetical protein [Candidatus Altiarchaeota archaeon]